MAFALARLFEVDFRVISAPVPLARKVGWQQLVREPWVMPAKPRWRSA